MTLLVDFNMIEEDGRIPALLPVEQVNAISPGASMLAADGEGTECQAVVTEISADGRLALLAPIEGAWNRDSTVRSRRKIILLL